MSGGTLCILATLAVLSDYWRWGNQPAFEDLGGVWASPAKWDRAIEVVTLLSVVLRTCIGAQLLVCAYMLATLTLDWRSEYPKPENRRKLVIYQEANSGPLGVFLAIWDAVHSHTNGKAFWLLTLLVVASVLSLACGFFTTILVSDLGSTALRSAPGTVVVFHGFKNFDFGEYLGDGRTREIPVDYPLFAEYRSSKRKLQPGSSDSPGFGDSGGLHRAFVPIANALDRQAVATYKGPAGMFASHIVCFPPKIASVQINATSGALASNLTAPSSKVVELLGRSHLKESIGFDIAGFTEEQWKGCAFDIKIPVGFIFTAAQTCFGKEFQAGLFFKNSDNDKDPAALQAIINGAFAGGGVYKADEVRTTYDGEWAIGDYFFSAMPGPLQLQYSLCIGKVAEIISVNVSLQGLENATEPLLSRSKPRVDRVNTTGVQRQLAVDGSQAREPSTNLERNIWTLLEFDSVQAGEFAHKLPQRTLFSNSLDSNIPWFVYDYRTVEVFGSIVVYNQAESLVQVSSPQEALFNSAMRDTGSLALAIEAFSTVMFSTNYYRNLDTLGRFDLSGSATLQRVIKRQIPRKWRGLCIILVFVIIHFLLVGTVFWKYWQSKLFTKVLKKMMEN